MTSLSQEPFCLLVLIVKYHFNISETDLFESFQTKREYKIFHQLNWNIWFIYSVLRLVGYSSYSSYSYRIFYNEDNDWKAQQGAEHIKLELFKPFHPEEPNGFLCDCSITMIDKTYG